MLPTLLLGSLHVGFNYMPFQWAVSFLTVIGVAFYSVKKKSSFLPAFVFCYLMASSLWAMWYLFYPEIAVTELQIQMAIASVMAAVSVIAVVTLAIFFSSRPESKWDALAIFTILNSLMVIGGYFFGFGKLPNGRGMSGFIDYSGLNGVLIALGVTRFFTLKRWVAVLCFVLALWAIVLSKGSISYGVLFVCLVARWLREGRSGRLAVLPIFGITCLLAMGGFQGHPLFDSSGRFRVYKVFLNAWWHEGHIWLGNGIGTFATWGKEVQIQTGFGVDPEHHTIEMWPWLHSDWAQMLPEIGVVGFVAILILYGDVLWRLWKKRSEYFDLAVGLGAASVFDYGARYFVPAFLMAYVVCVAYNRGNSSRVGKNEKNTSLFIASALS